jgi:hypothetical protein
MFVCMVLYKLAYVVYSNKCPELQWPLEYLFYCINNKALDHNKISIIDNQGLYKNQFTIYKVCYPNITYQIVYFTKVIPSSSIYSRQEHFKPWIYPTK